MHLGMDVSVSQVLLHHKTQWFHTIQNLCTAMSGAEPLDLPMEIQSGEVNIKSYSFSLSNGDTLIAFWRDIVAVEEDPGVKANVILQGFADHEVNGIDILHSFKQSIITGSENGDLILEDLRVRDCPMILHITEPAETIPKILITSDVFVEDRYDLNDMDLEGDFLKLDVSYSGGCRQHVFILTWDGNFAESLPVQVDLHLNRAR